MDHVIGRIPPEAEILPRSGTQGVIFSRSSATIFSSSSQRTAEWPRMSELIRTTIAPRTHASGMLVAASGSDNGRAGSGPWNDDTDGSTPVLWCCNKASPRPIVSFVRVSAACRQVCQGSHLNEFGSLASLSTGQQVRKIKNMMRTASAETCAHAVHAFSAFYLANE